MNILEIQKFFFEKGQTRNIDFRIEQLEMLKKAINSYEDQLLEALKNDLNKTSEEAFLTEIGPVYQEITHMIKHLPDWAKREKVKTAHSHTGSKGYIYHEPHGVCLIISPWNYPFQLAVAPLIGSIGGGNCSVLKPSELTPHTSAVLSKMLKEHFNEEYITVIEGDAETSQALLAQPFDYIFFTGSVAVGKKVMEAAAKHLTPVTLELGGKSPAIVDKTADLHLSAKRIAWGKFINAGQTCVAPDYVYVHQEVEQEFMRLLKKHIKQLYDQSWDKERYPTIVSKRHYERLVGFLDDGHIEIGGGVQEERLAIMPTVVTGVSWEAPVMQEEIFGPILPLFSYSDLNDVIVKIREMPSPLALYVFTESKDVEERCIHQLPFGGGCVNDTIMHLATPYLPFGGKGTSGMGAYHGHESFRSFTVKKSILKQTTKFDLPLRYKQGPLVMKLLRKLFMK
ncbi:aldehyde dehydrogenase [Bacillus suaedae]|uniref:Aldehyde dehydrogenase n=1 Tax=Halalkalibacter suaedae TaxID=2822140 RepID=A0A940WVB7_9BACI|nr:aldehyde dehydrogenase [Bacillus suaedae]MBP3952403.1 aldehyde dehydrogenase [Bacillus suaedae]